MFNENHLILKFNRILGRVADETSGMLNIRSKLNLYRGIIPKA